MKLVVEEPESASLEGHLEDRAVLATSCLALDAIHLASALRIEPDELVAYDRRLIAAAAARGLLVASAGAPA